MRKILSLLLITFLAVGAQAQELDAKVTVLAQQVGNNVNKSTFKTLQNALINFLNNRKWTDQSFKPNEKIKCNFLLNVSPTDDPNVYTAQLTIQSARPAFNTAYNSPIINYKDDQVSFKYIEFQQLEFNDNRVAGNDALVSNLTAVFAYYAYMIIGFDFDSFSPKGGQTYFTKAQNIVNNAPDGRGISGWQTFDGIRNRYWLAENMLNPRYDGIHTVYYEYYRNGIDQIYDSENTARTNILATLEKLQAFNAENPNTMINQFFFQGKSIELIQLYAKADAAQKIAARNLLTKLDLTNSTKYNEDLK